MVIARRHREHHLETVGLCAPAQSEVGGAVGRDERAVAGELFPVVVEGDRIGLIVGGYHRVEGAFRGGDDELVEQLVAASGADDVRAVVKAGLALVVRLPVALVVRPPVAVYRGSLGDGRNGGVHGGMGVRREAEDEDGEDGEHEHHDDHHDRRNEAAAVGGLGVRAAERAGRLAGIGGAGRALLRAVAGLLAAEIVARSRSKTLWSNSSEMS